jgi:hypothetical protein
MLRPFALHNSIKFQARTTYILTLSVYIESYTLIYFIDLVDLS